MRRAAGGWIIVGLLSVAACGSPSPARILTPTTPAPAPETASPLQAPPLPAALPTASQAAGAHAAGSHGGAVPPPAILLGNLAFHDQVSDGRSVVGFAEIDGSGGWVVVRADRAGAPGRVLGSVYRPDQTHDDVVTVKLKVPVRSGPLWVSLNVDAGVHKRLELPGPDQPIKFAGADLANRLVLTVR